MDLTQASLTQTQAFMLHHRQQQRFATNLTLDEAWETYDNSPKVEKMFKVTHDEFEFHWWLSSQQPRVYNANQILD